MRSFFRGRERGRATVLKPIVSVGNLYIGAIRRLNVTCHDVLGICGDSSLRLAQRFEDQIHASFEGHFRFTLKVVTPLDIQYSRSAAEAGMIEFGRRWLSGPADSGARSPHTVPAIRYSSGSSGPNSCPGC